MSFKEVTDVCRLCLKTEDLLWVFDKRFQRNEDMKDIISVSTGVQVALNDVISQKICKKCLQIAYKIFQFRATSIKNDTLLKDKYKNLNKEKLTTPCSSRGMTVEESETKPNSTNKIYESTHPSVKSIINKIPNLLLPKNCVHLDFAPYVSLPMNEVENYFKEHDRDIQQHIRSTFKALRAQNLSNASLIETKENSENKFDEHKSSKESQAISPINIKLTNNDKNEYSVVKKDDKINKVKIDLKRTFEDRKGDSPDVLPSTSKKLKLSEASSTSEETNSVISSLGLTPKKAKPESDGLIQLHYVQRSLETCNICSSVHYNHRDLKKHQQKHFRCQFCKTKFKSIELKDKHVQENCIIKKVMSSLPTIDLPKIEYDKDMRQKFPNAFNGFPALPGLDNKIVNSKDQDLPNINLEIALNVAAKHSVMVDTNIIEILSDDEDLIVNDTCAKVNSKKDNTQIAVSANNPSASLSTKNWHSSTSSNLTPQPKGVQKTCTSTGIYQVPSNTTSTVPNPSSSIVKPDIKIKNNYMLSTIDSKASDVVVLKELLKTYKELQLTKDVGTQQELPSNSSIKRNPNDRVVILQGLKQQLNIYKIPVEVKYGTYKVSFDYNTPQKKKRKMLGWSLLSPIDLKTPNPTKNNSFNGSILPNASNGQVAQSDISAKLSYATDNGIDSQPMNLTSSTTPNQQVAMTNTCSALQVPSPVYTSSGTSAIHPVVTNIRSSTIVLNSYKDKSSLNQHVPSSNSNILPQVPPLSYGSSVNLIKDSFSTSNKHPQLNTKRPSSAPTKNNNLTNRPIVTSDPYTSSQVILPAYSSSVSNQSKTTNSNFTVSIPPQNTNSLNQQIFIPNCSSSSQVTVPAPKPAVSNQSKNPQTNLTMHIVPQNNNSFNEQITVANSSYSSQGTPPSSSRSNQSHTPQNNITMTIAPQQSNVLNQQISVPNSTNSSQGTPPSSSRSNQSNTSQNNFTMTIVPQNSNSLNQQISVPNSSNSSQGTPPSSSRSNQSNTSQNNFTMTIVPQKSNSLNQQISVPNSINSSQGTPPSSSRSNQSNTPQNNFTMTIAPQKSNSLNQQISVPNSSNSSQGTPHSSLRSNQSNTPQNNFTMAIAPQKNNSLNQQISVPNSSNSSQGTPHSSLRSNQSNTPQNNFTMTIAPQESTLLNQQISLPHSSNSSQGILHSSSSSNQSNIPQNKFTMTIASQKNNSLNQDISIPNSNNSSQGTFHCSSRSNQCKTPQANFTTTIAQQKSNSFNQQISVPNSVISSQVIVPPHSSPGNNRNKTPQTNFTMPITPQNNNSLNQEIATPSSNISSQVLLPTYSSSIGSTRSSFVTNYQSKPSSQPTVASNLSNPVGYGTTDSLARNFHTVSNQNNTSQPVAVANAPEIFFNSSKRLLAHLLYQPTHSSSVNIPQNNIHNNICQVPITSTLVYKSNSAMTSNSSDYFSLSDVVSPPNVTLIPNVSCSIPSVPWSNHHIVPNPPVACPTAQSSQSNTYCMPNSTSVPESQGPAPTSPVIWVKNIVELK